MLISRGTVDTVPFTRVILEMVVLGSRDSYTNNFPFLARGNIEEMYSDALPRCNKHPKGKQRCQVVGGVAEDLREQ